MFQVYHLKYFNVRLARLGSLHIAILLYHSSPNIIIILMHKMVDVNIS